jgi:hypothetical protein
MQTTMRRLNIRTDMRITASRWEPCAAFSTGEHDEPICARCGWLQEEHPES